MLFGLCKWAFTYYKSFEDLNFSKCQDTEPTVIKSRKINEYQLYTLNSRVFATENLQVNVSLSV